MPIYIHDYIDPNANTAMILIADPLIVITLTVAANALTRKDSRVSRNHAWDAADLHRLAGHRGKRKRAWSGIELVVVALGEITQSPRYYEYVSRLAPAGQQGTYLGFAFLPIGIGSLVGGVFGGALLTHFGETTHQPATIWLYVTGVGVLTTILLWIYDRFVISSQNAT